MRHRKNYGDKLSLPTHNIIQLYIGIRQLKIPTSFDSFLNETLCTVTILNLYAIKDSVCFHQGMKQSKTIQYTYAKNLI